MEQAVKAIFDRSMRFERAAEAAQYRVGKDDLHTLHDIFDNKKISIKEIPYNGDEADGTWLLRNVTLPVTQKENHLYFGDSVVVDTDKLYWMTTIGKSNALTGEPIRAWGVWLIAYHFDGIYHDKNGKEVVERMPDETMKTYYIYRTISKAKDLMEFDGAKYDGAYFVTADGYVFTKKASKKPKLTPLVPGDCGEKNHYIVVRLTDIFGKTHSINLHRLIATLFVENDDPLNKTDVNHRDVNPKNNAADNLEWCTKAYNAKYSPVFRALKKALPDIDCREWLDEAHDITERVLNGEDRAELVGEAVRRILTRNNLATAG